MITYEKADTFIRSQQWDEIIRNKPLAAGLGVLSHLLLAQGEPDHSMYIVLMLWATVLGLVTYVEYTLDERVHSIGDAVLVSGSAAAVYFGTLIVSMGLYRAFFHRLRKFPGPFMARLSKWYGVSLVLPDFQYYWKVQKLHEKYGDIVRTGPRELSVATADAVPLIHGIASKCTKGPWYDSAKHIEGSSLHSTRSKQDHKERRRIWDRAFNAKSLREYEPRINRHSFALMQKLKENAHEPSLRISNWVNFYSFDVMGDIGFSRSFGMLAKGEEDYLITSLHKSMAPMSVFGHVGWLMNLILRTAVGAKDIRDFMDWTSKVLRDRKKAKVVPKENDIFSWLLDPNDEDIPLHLNADTRLVIVAGSDTTAASLTWLCYELCKNPEAQAKLRQIIDDAASDKTFLDVEDVANIPHLDGVINEGMRLHPGVPSGVQRETPPEGLRFRDIYIPGNTLIWMPIHTMQRDERYFPDPLKFVPERWTTERPDLLVDKRAFMPFSTGVYSCIGQKLAMMEIRSVIANLVRNFEIEFAADEDGGAAEKKTRDCFTLNVGKLDVRLIPRQSAKV
ncbi:cytochrome P450 [Zopfia rhizophila CBS 207.26]|uniref:Cytochrome P450 n=1 Tax=Zopfia rhizophila CBS 207.26 TaxID=1314779 RepID=A0A6A6DCL6_9PEZI|nr:cytochrome P450 [Zopfia rhizophila CBS 207.26]